MLKALFGNGAAKAVDSVAGTSLADDDEPMEDQPNDQEILISELQATIDAQKQQMLRDHTPQTVGVVEPRQFDPQDHLDILTELFGVYKGMGKTYDYECSECWHTWSTAERLDGDDTHTCPDCGDSSQDGDELSDGCTEQIMTSREPTETELVQVCYGEGGGPPFFLRPPLRKMLSEHFAQLHGEETDMPLDWGSKNHLHQLPKAEVVEEEEFDEED